MSKYRVTVSKDELGGVYEVRRVVLETDGLKEAISRAEELTADGHCGLVHRNHDDAVLAPNGCWINAEGDNMMI